MPRYETNPQKSVMIPLETPSCDGGLIYVPSRLGGAARSSIQSKAMVMRHMPYSEQEIAEAKEKGEELPPRVTPEFDPTAAAAELLVQSCVDKRAYTNLTNDKDQTITMTRGWVEFQMDEDDFLHLALVLFYRMWEQMEDAEGPEDAPKEGDGPLASTEDQKETTATAGGRKRKSRTS